MSRIWLTTDTHFGHDKMIEYCGRPDGFERLIFKGLSSIPHHDTLIHLGDVCMGKDGALHEKWVRPLPCRKVLVLGNHDRKSRSWYSSHGWDFVAERIHLTEFGYRIAFSHQPLDDDGSFDLNIHGHEHNKPQGNGKKNFLFSLESLGFNPMLLDTFIQKHV